MQIYDDLLVVSLDKLAKTFEWSVKWDLNAQVTVHEALAMWIFKDPKQIWERPSIEIHKKKCSICAGLTVSNGEKTSDGQEFSSMATGLSQILSDLFYIWLTCTGQY